MKQLATALFFASLSSTVFAGPRANVYECSGPDVSVGMTTSSYTGRPTLSVNYESAAIPSSPLESVSLVNGPTGIQVTGSFAGIADATLTYTLLVPNVNISDVSIDKIHGMLVRTMTNGFFAGHDKISGPIESNDFIPVVCQASAAKF